MYSHHHHHFIIFTTYIQQRNAKNPRTGAVVLVPAKERVRFKAFTNLKQVVQHQQQQQTAK
jgi:nucleoid DNA-binding protein